MLKCSAGDKCILITRKKKKIELINKTQFSHAWFKQHPGEPLASVLLPFPWKRLGIVDYLVATHSLAITACCCYWKDGSVADRVLLDMGYTSEFLWHPDTSSPCTSFPFAQGRGIQAAANDEEREDGTCSCQMSRSKNEGNCNSCTNPAPAIARFGLYQCEML